MRTPLALILMVALAIPAIGKTPLRENSTINNQLLVVGLANEIRKRCDSISGRLLKGASKLRSIQKQAIAQGYSKDEIRTYVESDVEKDRMKEIGRVWLANRGASPEEPDTMCRVGREEIAKNSSIGGLLYEN